MNSVLEILLALAVAGYVIFRQVQGEALRGKRVVVLPLILAVIGVVTLTKNGVHPTGTDIACIAVGAAIALVIGAGQGWSMVLESRAGALWGRMPLRGLWWWAALIVSRVAMMVIAHGLDAKVAASTAPILLILGINRVGQALVIAPRAMARSIPFAPEKDGSTFMSGSSPLGARLGRLAPPPAPPAPPLDHYPMDHRDRRQARRADRDRRHHRY
jgi:hypothetical protein